MKRLTDVIFDFDGTLVDSAPAILKTFQGVLDRQGITPQVILDNSLIGPPLAVTMGKISGISDPTDIQGLIEDFKSTYDEVGVQATHCYPFIEAQLTELQQNGLRLHIATNKRMNPTMRILTHLGLSVFFDRVYSIDRTNPNYASKSAMISALMSDGNLKPGTACYVGDRSEDAYAANSNNLHFFLASWGYQDYLYPSSDWVVIDSSDNMANAIICRS